MVHVCDGKVTYNIQTEKHLYQLELDSTDVDWKNTYLLPEFKSLTLMRWIRKDIEKDNGNIYNVKMKRTKIKAVD